MAFRRLRRLARRARERAREPSTTTSADFSAARDGAMAALDTSSEGVFAVLGAAVVSSWEVALTDLSRALRGRISDAKQAELIERMSDALVPTESPFSGAGKRFSHAVKMATKAALESGRLEDATHPLGEAVGVLGSAVAQGWPKTVGHMEPLIEALGQPDQTRASLLELGPRMQSALDDAWRGYVVELETLGQCPDLEQGLIDALESWKDEAIRAMEVLLYESRTVLVDAAEAVTESV